MIEAPFERKQVKNFDCKEPFAVYYVPFFACRQQAKQVQTDMTYQQLKSLEVKSANDLSKKGGVITDLQTVSI